jgi:hypothetical protein
MHALEPARIGHSFCVILRSAAQRIGPWPGRCSNIASP